MTRPSSKQEQEQEPPLDAVLRHDRDMRNRYDGCTGPHGSAWRLDSMMSVSIFRY